MQLPTIQRSIMLAAGAALLVAAAIMAWPAANQTAPRTTSGERAMNNPGLADAAGTVGIGAQAIDPARRDKLANGGQFTDTPAPFDGSFRPHPPPAPTPPQAITPDAAAVAENEAILAVLPAATRQVEATITARRAAIRQACWTGDGPSSASFKLEASFAADGTLLSRSIADDRQAPGIGPCVRAQELPLAIDPPGQPLTVQATITLP
jgi:hypothetical protein